VCVNVLKRLFTLVAYIKIIILKKGNKLIDCNIYKIWCPISLYFYEFFSTYRRSAVALCLYYFSFIIIDSLCKDWIKCIIPIYYVWFFLTPHQYSVRCRVLGPDIHSSCSARRWTLISLYPDTGKQASEHAFHYLLQYTTYHLFQT
jgi:hypothetical protein